VKCGLPPQDDHAPAFVDNRVNDQANAAAGDGDEIALGLGAVLDSLTIHQVCRIVRDVTAATSSSPLSVRRATMCW
jgi:hypothetical protein